MNQTRLRLWQESALKPDDYSASVWCRRRTRSSVRRPEGDTSPTDPTRVRRSFPHTRATALYGFVLSGLMALPTGWVFAYSTLAPDGQDAAQCTEIGSFLDPELRRSLRGYRGAGGLSPSQRSLLQTEVCDPFLQAVLPSLARGITTPDDARKVWRTLSRLGIDTDHPLDLRAIMGAVGR